MTSTNLLPILLACLSMIESGDDDKKIGDHGRSRGRYQISRAAWNTVVSKPWSVYAHKKAWADTVAATVLNRRLTAFRMIWHREPTVFEIYILWNAPAQAMKGKISKTVLARAKRFENLVEDRIKKGTK